MKHLKHRNRLGLALGLWLLFGPLCLTWAQVTEHPPPTSSTKSPDQETPQPRPSGGGGSGSAGG